MRSVRLAVAVMVVGVAGCTSWHGEIARVAVDPALAEVRPKNNDVLTGRDLSKREDAFYVLLNAGMFCPGRYGYAGGVSPMLKAVQTVMRQPDAGDAFEDLCRRGSPEGRLYGACGLWLVDRKRLKHVAERLAKDAQMASVAEGGCEIRGRKVAEVFKARDGKSDVEGGGYPRMMARLMQ